MTAKVKIYIVTYKSTDLLIRCLSSLFDGSNDMSNCRVSVMNNYVPNHKSELTLPASLAEKVTVIDNSARPAFSTGHLSRSWNECIMDGFRDIKNPDCDVLILAQGDSMFAPGALARILELLPKYNYIALGAGDEVQIMTPESIRRIGLYDERFCGIGYQEADYFRRAILYNPQGSSINDTYHGRVFNPIKTSDIICKVPCGHARKDPEYSETVQHHLVSKSVFSHKWQDLLAEYWTKSGFPTLTFHPKQHMMYPYFERSLPDLREKYFCY